MKISRAIRFVLLIITVVTVSFLAGTQRGSGLPASSSYREVMAAEPTKDISNLQAVHHQRFVKEWVWMRFDTTDEALSRILKNRRKVQNEALIELAKRAQSHLLSKSIDEAARNSVGWDEVGQIKHPEYFDLGRSVGNRTWYTTAIVDRENKAVYIFAVGD